MNSLSAERLYFRCELFWYVANKTRDKKKRFFPDPLLKVPKAQKSQRKGLANEVP